MGVQASIVPLGECALIIKLGDSIDSRIHKAVLQLAESLGSHPFPGFEEAVPTYATVAVYYNPVVVAAAMRRQGLDNGQIQLQVCRWLNERIEQLASIDAGSMERIGKTVRIPVCYCPECGPDLEYVAGYHKLSTDEVVSIHTSGTYTVYLIGFMPGFPYLGGLSDRIATPRLDTPRAAVPAGSVGIAGSQTGVYPLASPGGWRLIGRTSVTLFRPELRPPSLLSGGDTVRFEPVAHSDMEAGDSR